MGGNSRNNNENDIFEDDGEKNDYTDSEARRFYVDDGNIALGHSSNSSMTAEKVITADVVGIAQHISGNEGHKFSEGGVRSGSDGRERKGRNSIEEIVGEAVQLALQAKECRMHPCGREDIDVRVLGNGRPFALEVLLQAAISIRPHEIY